MAKGKAIFTVYTISGHKASDFYLDIYCFPISLEHPRFRFTIFPHYDNLTVSEVFSDSIVVNVTFGKPFGGIKLYTFNE